MFRSFYAKSRKLAEHKYSTAWVPVGALVVLSEIRTQIRCMQSSGSV